MWFFGHLSVILARATQPQQRPARAAAGSAAAEPRSRWLRAGAEPGLLGI